MKRASSISSLFILLVCSFPFLSIAQTFEIGEWTTGITSETYSLIFGLYYSKQDAIVFQEKWKLIGEENARSNNDEWVGNYFDREIVHDDMIVLRWSQNSGFAFVSMHNCSPTLTGLNYGKAVLSPEWFEVFPEVSNQPDHHDNPHVAHSRKLPAKRFVPVKWGERHYMVAEDSVAKFYDYVAGLGAYQPNTDPWEEPGFLLKMEDQDKTAKGMPILPPGHERHVKHPIEAGITAVGPRVITDRHVYEGTTSYGSITPLTIDQGRAEGVKKGMRFYISGSKEKEELTITSVRRHSSRGIIKRTLDDRKRAIFKDWKTESTRPYPEITTGRRATTSYLLSQQF
ncbi:MAG TPA: hypothetical protein VLR90_08485 [Blastocatellia bacterium]|nr:hypothetical protein [Blastocatellia bacterium]